MDYPTASTTWPSPEPANNVKSLINLFFTLADSRDDNAGDRSAKEIFTPDGEFILVQGSFKGSSGTLIAIPPSFNFQKLTTVEIATSRRDAWVSIQKRHHVVLKVYANDSDGMVDLFLVGNLDMTKADGDQVSSQFIARMLIQQTDSGPRLRQYRVIATTGADGTPYIQDP